MQTWSTIEARILESYTNEELLTTAAIRSLKSIDVFRDSVKSRIR